MSNIAQSSPCVKHSIIIDSEDSREPNNRLISEDQVLNNKSEFQVLSNNSAARLESLKDNCEISIEPVNDNWEIYLNFSNDNSEVKLLSDDCEVYRPIELQNDNSENSVESTCNDSENNVISRNNDSDESLTPTLNSSSDYLQPISDDQNYLQLTSEEPNTTSNLQPVNERPLCSNDHIEPSSIIDAEQAEYDQIVDEYDEIVDVTMVDFQSPNNTRSRNQQYNNLACDDVYTESSFESTSMVQQHHAQDVVLPADETPSQNPAILKVCLSLVVFGLVVLAVSTVLNLRDVPRTLAEHDKTAALNSNNVAFYIGTSHSILPTNSLNAFNKLLINVNSLLDLTRGMLSSFAQPGIYWFQLSAGVPAYTGTKVTLNGLTHPVVIYSTVTSYPDDVMVADTIQTVDTSQRLSVVNETPLIATSDTNMAVSLVGFRLDSIMDVTSQVIFAVQLTYDIRPRQGIVDTLIVFDRVLVNVGSGWDVASSSFKTPYEGDYFFSFAAGSATRELHLVLNRKQTCITSSLEDHTISNFTHSDVIPSRSAIMSHLTTKDIITFTTPRNQPAYSTSDGLVNAQGFLYRLQDSQLSVAWSLVNIEFGYLWCKFGRLGPVDRVSYRTVLVNVGGAWQSHTSTVVIPADGTYFIDLTTYFCGTGWGGNGNPVTQLKINNRTAISLQLLNINFNGCVSRSRSVVVSVKTGDQLHVSMPSAACYFDESNRRYQTFTGLRLF